MPLKQVKTAVHWSPQIQTLKSVIKLYHQDIKGNLTHDGIKFDFQAEEDRINREKQLEQEERIAKELARINYETQREEKMRQYIKENR